MIANPGSKGTGCGCGGGGTLSAAACSCGGAGCGSCHAQGIVRPRFFAGQLLTEDDLQLLTDYVGQKNRLHNRHLFGAGVVCGLEVGCHPCRDGRVIVHPGYALDCCGNDLTLSCAQTLDINAMVRDLRLAGFDCVDPCPEPPKNGTKTKTPQGEMTPGQEEKEEKPRLGYCLYLRYCEQPSDPVAPYSTGEDCVQVGCEATRIREGVKFELRCSPSHNAGSPLIQRLCACLGDIDKLPEILDAVKRLRANGALLSHAKRSETKALSVDEVGSLKTKTQTLIKLTGRTFGETADSPRAAEAATLADTKEGVVARPQIDAAFIKSFGEIAVVVNRFDQLPPIQQRELLSTAGPELETTLNQSREIIRFSMNVSLADTNQPFNVVRDWLIERLNKSAFITDCTLIQRVYELVLPRENPNQSFAEFSVAGENSQELFEAFVDYLRDCICRALNPACVPCEDSAVLLACLEVEECQVKNICNMERTFVLSPAAVRYWLPPLQLIGNLVERLCCDPLHLFPSKQDSSDPDFEQLLKEEIVRIIKDSLCDVSDQTLDRLLGGVEDLVDKRTKSQRTPSSAKRKSSLADFLSSGSEAAAKSAARVEPTRTRKTARVAASEPAAPTTKEETSPPETAGTPAESETKMPEAVKKTSAMRPGKAATKNGRTTPAAPATAETETPSAPPAEPPKGGTQ